MATVDGPSLGIVALLERVRAEFLEAPGMRLSEAQVTRLFHLDALTTISILTALCDVGFLVKDASGRYARVLERSTPRASCRL
jgi:hypothetical protein